MNNKNTPLKSSFKFRTACILLAGLTACSTGRAPYVWHDLGAQKQRDAVKSGQDVEVWGADSESASVQDPRIAPGFLLNVASLEDKKLNGDFRVDFDGNLQLPYNVSVNAGGLTLSQLKKKLMELYRPYFKTSSEIDVHVRERKTWIDVRGLVQKPGRYLVEPNASLDEVIVGAGGPVREMPPQFVRIQKGQKTFSLDLNQYYSRGEAHPQVVAWTGGEVVFLQKEMADSTDDKFASSPYRLPIYVLGEVRKPGEYPLKSGADFLDALILANGFTDRADLDRIEMVRRSGGRKRSYAFTWDELQRAPAPLQGDVIVVHADHEAKFTRWIQISTLLVSLLTSVAIVYELEKTNNHNRRP